MLFLKKYSLLSLLLCAHFSVLLSVTPQEKAEREKSIKRRIKQNNLMEKQQLRALLKQTNSGKTTPKKQAKQTKLQNALQTVQSIEQNPQEAAQQEIQAITTYVSPKSKADAEYQKTPAAILKGKAGELKAQVKVLSNRLTEAQEAQQETARILESSVQTNNILMENNNSFIEKLAFNEELFQNLSKKYDMSLANYIQSANDYIQSVKKYKDLAEEKKAVEESLIQASDIIDDLSREKEFLQIQLSRKAEKAQREKARTEDAKTIARGEMWLRENAEIIARGASALQQNEEQKRKKAEETAARAVEMYNQGMSIYDQQKEQNANMLNMAIEEVVGAGKSIEDNLKKEYTVQRQYKKRKEAQEKLSALADATNLLMSDLATANKTMKESSQFTRELEEKKALELEMQKAALEQRSYQKSIAQEQAAEKVIGTLKGNLATTEAQLQQAREGYENLLEENKILKMKALNNKAMKERNEKWKEKNDYNNRLYVKTAEWMKENPYLIAGVGLGGAAAGFGYAGYSGRLPGTMQPAFNKVAEAVVNKAANPAFNFMSNTVTKVADAAPKVTWNTVTSYVSNGFSSLGSSLSNTFSKFFGK